MEVSVHQAEKTALVFGGSGLIGRHLIDFLLLDAAYARVKVFGRKPLAIEHSKLQQFTVDFDQLDRYLSWMAGDDVFLCLGTTMAKAGSKEAFYKVDFTYTFQAAKVAFQAGAKQAVLVSSMGASARSKVYYSKVKGQIEDAINKLPFWAVHIMQPSLLLGDRVESRFGEKVGAIVGKALYNRLWDVYPKYTPIEANIVAKAMVEVAQQLKEGKYTYTSDQIKKIVA